MPKQKPQRSRRTPKAKSPRSTFTEIGGSPVPGLTLRQSAADLARAHGAEALWWGVYERNESALQFYEGLGARHVEGLRFMAIDVDSLKP